MDDVQIIETRHDDHEEDSIIYQQIEDDEFRKMYEDDAHDVEGEDYILMKDILLQEDDCGGDNDDDVDDHSKHEEHVEFGQSSPTIINDNIINEQEGTQLLGVENRKQVQLKTDKILKKSDCLQEDLVPQHQPKLQLNCAVIEETAEISETSRDKYSSIFLKVNGVSSVLGRTMTDNANSELILIGEMVTEPNVQYHPGHKVPRFSRFFKCIYCNYKARTKNKLKVHYRVHSLEKPYDCKICGKWFKQNHHVTEHLRIHTGERPFKCSVCEKTFMRSHHLKRHSIQHHKR
ncbi:zinc finger protein 155 isoform X2 [Nilaparvata lugens]|nr:zinc finger protein 155 isoform X2 [Nilaparvata lugens]